MNFLLWLRKYLGISRVSVRNYLLKNIPYKQYIISANTPLDKENYEVSSLALAYTAEKISQQSLLLTNKESRDTKEFSTVKEAAERYI